MKISVHQAEKLSLEQIRLLVTASEGVRFESEHRRQMYGWVECVLVEQEYLRQGKAARGLVRRYVEKMTGPATRRILEREFEVYGKREFERLAAISNGHLYNLRASPRYRERRLNYTKT
ncbi:MAG: hypothetical protein ACYCOR_16495, partial [Acidobacteriaceae bacterium]